MSHVFFVSGFHDKKGEDVYIVGIEFLIVLDTNTKNEVGE